MYDRDRARRATRQRIIELGLSLAEVARRAGISVTTLKNFLTPDGSWPRAEKRGAIESAIAWEVGSIEAIAEGSEPPRIVRTDDPQSRSVVDDEQAVTVPGPSEASQVVVVLGEWSRKLTPLQRAAYEADIQAYALRLAVEMDERTRAHRDEPAQQ